MADSVSTEAWLDQRRWAALEEALKAQGSNVKRHLQDYLITLYNETVPLCRLRVRKDVSGRHWL